MAEVPGIEPVSPGEFLYRAWHTREGQIAALRYWPRLSAEHRAQWERWAREPRSAGTNWSWVVCTMGSYKDSLPAELVGAYGNAGAQLEVPRAHD